MSFLSRFLGWALLLGLPAWAFGDGYRRLLARALEAVLAGFGQRVELERVEALAPMDLALFASLTLASDAWSWPRRARALVVGALALIALEIATWSLYLASLMSTAAGGTASRATQPLWHSVLGAAGWLAAVAAWLLLEGGPMLDRVVRREPEAGRGASRSTKPPG